MSSPASSISTREAHAIIVPPKPTSILVPADEVPPGCPHRDERDVVCDADR